MKNDLITKQILLHSIYDLHISDKSLLIKSYPIRRTLLLFNDYKQCGEFVSKLKSLFYNSNGDEKKLFCNFYEPDV
jgi:hypothetical protein